MKNRIFAIILALLFAALSVSPALAEEDDGPPPDEPTAYADYVDFGPYNEVERDASGTPVAINGFPVREVHAAINIRSNREAYRYSIWFPDYPFFRPATQYDGNLAVMSLAMALSANRALNPSEESEEQFDPSLHLEQFLTDAGFENIRKDDYSKETSMYTISMAMGARRMTAEGEEPFTLIAIGVCGGGYKNEWQSNLTPGEGELHEGFLSASNLVIDRLAGYILTNGIQGRIKVWISGFSRAAAVSNVTAGLLVRDGVFPKEDVYAYTFATPAAVHDAPESGYENIFNILNPMDIVPQVMPADWGFSRYGTDLYIPVTEFSSIGELFTSTRADVARDTFGIEANYSPALNLRMRLLLSMIEDVAESREQYNAELQPAILSIMQRKNASNLLSTLRSLLLTAKDSGRESRINVDTLIDYILRVFGSALTRSEYRSANQNSGSLVRRLFNEHCEDAYLANVDIIRVGAFEEDFAFTYVLIRGPVNVYLTSDVLPQYRTMLNSKGQVIVDPSLIASGITDQEYLREIADQYYMERIGDTSVIAVPHDDGFTIDWEAVRDGTLEIRLADCSVRASSRYEGATSAPLAVRKGETGVAYRSVRDDDRIPDGFTRTVFSASDLASFIGIASIGINWRVALTLLCVVIGLLATVFVWLGLLLQRRRRKPGFWVWLCLCVFCICVVEAEAAFWFFADQPVQRMFWKALLAVALLALFLIRHFRETRAGLLLPGFLLLLVADIVICRYFLPGMLLFLLAHGLFIFAFLYRSPMPRKIWIQWIAVSLLSAALILLGFLKTVGPLAWAAVAYAAVLLLMNYTVGGQPQRIRFAARLFLFSDLLMGVYLTVYPEPIIHIVYMLLFDVALLMIAVYKTGGKLRAKRARKRKEPAQAEDLPAPEPA